MKFCDSCGVKLENNQNFCPNCGKKLKENNINEREREKEVKIKCPKCGSENVNVQIVSHNKNTGCLTILLYIILALTIIGIPIMIIILLSKGKKSVNKKYYVCQNCGHTFNSFNQLIAKDNNAGKNITAISSIIIIIFCVIVAVAISTMDDSDLQKNVSKNIGEELICNKYKVVINSFNLKTGSIDSFQEVPSGTEWIGIIVTATNTSEEDVSINSSNFKIVNSNGEILNYDVISYKVWGNYDTLGGKLAPGGTKTGYVSFSNTNTDNSNLTLNFKCGTWQNGSYSIPLK